MTGNRIHIVITRPEFSDKKLTALIRGDIADGPRLGHIVFPDVDFGIWNRVARRVDHVARDYARLARIPWRLRNCSGNYGTKEQDRGKMNCLHTQIP